MSFHLISSAYAAEWTGDCVFNGVATIRGVECLFKNIIGPIPALIALVAVGMIILAGIRLISAGADPKAVAAAWKTFIWAVIGLVLLSAAYFILVLISKFTGTDVTTFTIPTS